MRTSDASSLYEGGPLREVTGSAIRPGGLMLTDRALDFCRFQPGAKILDVGCGAGGTVEHLITRYELEAVGVDPSPNLIAEGLQRNPALPLMLGDAQALPFAESFLDGLFCECVLSLVEKPQDALSEFRRVLRPGGRLILSDIYSTNGVGGETDRAEGAAPAARSILERRLAESSFTIEVWEDHSLLLKELAAQLVLAGGSLDGFCCCRPSGGRPGYYLLVARRT